MKDETNPVDFEKFKNETGLDDETVKDLFQGFLEELLEEKNKLMVQLSDKDYIKLAGTIHNIKGISSSYMAGIVYIQALKLDLKLKSNDFEDVDTMVRSLIKYIDQAAKEITYYCMQ